MQRHPVGADESVGSLVAKAVRVVFEEVFEGVPRVSGFIKLDYRSAAAAGGLTREAGGCRTPIPLSAD